MLLSHRVGGYFVCLLVWHTPIMESLKLQKNAVKLENKEKLNLRSSFDEMNCFYFIILLFPRVGGILFVL